MKKSFKVFSYILIALGVFGFGIIIILSLIPSDEIHTHQASLNIDATIEIFDLKNKVTIKNGGTDFHKFYDMDMNHSCYAIKLNPQDLKKIQSQLIPIAKNATENLPCSCPVDWLPKNICTNGNFSANEFKTFLSNPDPKNLLSTLILTHPESGQVFLFTHPDYPSP